MNAIPHHMMCKSHGFRSSEELHFTSWRENFCSWNMANMSHEGLKTEWKGGWKHQQSRMQESAPGGLSQNTREYFEGPTLTKNGE